MPITYWGRGNNKGSRCTLTAVRLTDSVWRLLLVRLLAHKDVLRASTDVAHNATTPDELASASDRLRTSVFVVAASAAQRVAVGLTQSSLLGRAVPSPGPLPPHTAPARRRRTVIGRPVDVDQLLLADASSVVVVLPLPSSSSPTSLPGGSLAVVRHGRRPDQRGAVSVERGSQGAVVQGQQTVADRAEDGKLTPAGLERAAAGDAVAFARYRHVVAHRLKGRKDHHTTPHAGLPHPPNNVSL